MLLPAPTPPLILTLTLDAASQAFFDELRRRHFPPARNVLAAHLTLFHALPGQHETAISARLAADAAAQAGPLLLAVTAVHYTGQGVSYALDHAGLRALHSGWQRQWQAGLSAQDQQKLRPHVTVQNKVSSTTARALYEELQADFQPFEALGTGFALWAYRGGPWEWRAAFPFGG